MKTAMEIITERLDVLAGTRTRDKNAAAVRIEDLIGITQVPATLASKVAAGTPTKAEYDALWRDVTTLHKQLRLVADALFARLNP